MFVCVSQLGLVGVMHAAGLEHWGRELTRIGANPTAGIHAAIRHPHTTLFGLDRGVSIEARVDRIRA